MSHEADVDNENYVFDSIFNFKTLICMPEID